MNGFGFIEYEDAMDARDVVPGTYHAMRNKAEPILTVSSFPYVIISTGFATRPSIRN